MTIRQRYPRGQPLQGKRVCRQSVQVAFSRVLAIVCLFERRSHVGVSAKRTNPCVARTCAFGIYKAAGKAG
ncbi:MAG: hypothetical protein KME46_27170 [Brasilonema angustatum HA4187-MV1]|nr:hypothetical protein [Brasilonema angustatum HA4187-MV1]